MGTYAEIVLRTIGALVLMLFVARLLGKQTISNMTFHDFVTGITIGAVSANMAFNYALPFKYVALSLAVMAATSFILSIIALKSRKWRKWISGSPTVLIEGGQILEANMRKAKYTIDSLIQSLREKDVFNIEEVEYAMLEDNGKLSVLKKSKHRPVTVQDLQLPAASDPLSFPVELIMDGKMIEQNLWNNGMTPDWLTEQLRSRGKDVSDVFYAVRGTRHQLVFDYYSDGIRNPIHKEK